MYIHLFLLRSCARKLLWALVVYHVIQSSAGPEENHLQGFLHLPGGEGGAGERAFPRHAYNVFLIYVYVIMYVRMLPCLYA